MTQVILDRPTKQLVLEDIKSSNVWAWNIFRHFMVNERFSKNLAFVERRLNVVSNVVVAS